GRRHWFSGHRTLRLATKQKSRSRRERPVGGCTWSISITSQRKPCACTLSTVRIPRKFGWKLSLARSGSNQYWAERKRHPRACARRLWSRLTKNAQKLFDRTYFVW